MKRIFAALVFLTLLSGCTELPPVSSPAPPTAEPTPAAAPEVQILDRTQTESLECAEAEEVFWEDGTYSYVFPCIKSQYVTVILPEGSTLSLQAALEQGIITPEDLTDAGISYARVETAEEFQVCLGSSPDTEIALVRRMAFSETYTERGWLCADGVPLSVMLQEAWPLPTLSYDPELVLSLTDFLDLTGVTAYDAALEPVVQGADLSVLAELPSGEYTLVLRLVRTGRFVESEQQHEQFGYDCFCTLTVESGPETR